MKEDLEAYLVIPHGDDVGMHTKPRSQAVALTPELAVKDMATRDNTEFSCREDQYDVWTHQKVPRFVGTYDAPPAEECVDHVLPVEGTKACGCGGARSHATPEGIEAKLVALFISEGVQDPAGLALKVLKLGGI